MVSGEVSETVEQKELSENTIVEPAISVEPGTFTESGTPEDAILADEGDDDADADADADTDTDTDTTDIPDGNVPRINRRSIDTFVEEIPDEAFFIENLLPEESSEVEISDGDVPLTNLPDEDVPLISIPDEDIPLANVPKTGDNSQIWIFLALFSGAGLGYMLLKDKRREEGAR